MKKLFYLISIAILSFWPRFGYAENEENNAIYVWVDGTSTCYQLSAMPKVSYEGTNAVLTLAGQTEPVLTLSLEDGGKLVVTFGIYDDTSALESINSFTPVSKVGKYIKGGRLVIVRDGKLFDAEGRLLTNE